VGFLSGCLAFVGCTQAAAPGVADETGTIDWPAANWPITFDYVSGGSMDGWELFSFTINADGSFAGTHEGTVPDQPPNGSMAGHTGTEFAQEFSGEFTAVSKVSDYEYLVELVDVNYADGLCWQIVYTETKEEDLVPTGTIPTSEKGPCEDGWYSIRLSPDDVTYHLYLPSPQRPELTGIFGVLPAGNPASDQSLLVAIPTVDGAETRGDDGRYAEFYAFYGDGNNR